MSVSTRELDRRVNAVRICMVNKYDHEAFHLANDWLRQNVERDVAALRDREGPHTNRPLEIKHAAVSDRAPGTLRLLCQAVSA